jgi:hypothetical protein
MVAYADRERESRGERRRDPEVDDMGAAYETIICRGCGTRITIRKLEWSGDRSAYAQNEKFNVDVPCEVCDETFSYRTPDIELVEAGGAQASGTTRSRT